MMALNNVSYIYFDGKNRTIEARLSCAFKKRREWYFAECPELQLVDQGKSKREALENLNAMITASIVEAFEAGKLGEMLVKLGFRKQELPLRDREIFRQELESAGDLQPLPLEIPLVSLVNGRRTPVCG
jgi:hypothetical protein